MSNGSQSGSNTFSGIFHSSGDISDGSFPSHLSLSQPVSSAPSIPLSLPLSPGAPEALPEVQSACILFQHDMVLYTLTKDKPSKESNSTLELFIEQVLSHSSSSNERLKEEKSPILEHNWPLSPTIHLMSWTSLMMDKAPLSAITTPTTKTPYRRTLLERMDTSEAARSVLSTNTKSPGLEVFTLSHRSPWTPQGCTLHSPTCPHGQQKSAWSPCGVRAD
ncbi:hypothetical protein BDZ94DRAFT_1314770 [Collybia nuda]|uniref:Uncharacterized protein n=1 Tax=Collybia nuda TaxID=64659 RepID=A0A9P6CDA4_9AGAR|nr:hypothetical protein BDZ94DRAFT_1314770 [Collybia nuda]